MKKMGRYQTEAAYLKSVLLWLQGDRSEPDPPRSYPLGSVDRKRHGTIPPAGRMLD